MSLFEILVILTVALLVIKPEDIPSIIKKLKGAQNFVNKNKQELINYFDPETSKNKSDDINTQMDQINFYLQKISDLGGEYQGDYSIDSIKEYYRKTMNQKIRSELKDDLY